LNLRESDRQRRTTYARVFEMFYLAAQDILVRALPDISTASSMFRKHAKQEEIIPILERSINELDQLRQYYNKELDKVYKWLPPSKDLKCYYLSQFFNFGPREHVAAEFDDT
jgi:hypothetical protein